VVEFDNISVTDEVIRFGDLFISYDKELEQGRVLEKESIGQVQEIGSGNDIEAPNGDAAPASPVVEQTVKSNLPIEQDFTDMAEGKTPTWDWQVQDSGSGSITVLKEEGTGNPFVQI